MAPTRGTKNENGYLVKAISSGEPWPEEESLYPIFKDANVKTLPDVLKYGAKMYSNENFMATRTIQAREHKKENGKMFEKLSLGEYTWKTYSEVQSSAEAVGCSLNKMNFKHGDRIAMFAETRAEWFIAAMGALQQRICVCTIYTTLSDSGIVHALNETEVNLVFTSCDLLPRMCRILSYCPKITTVVVIEDQLNGIGEIDQVPTSASVISFSEFSCEKNITKERLEVKPDPDDIAIIMYTSGSTGTPKGVEMSHTNIMASVIAYSCQVNVGMGDRYLAFLPIAHILELATEVALIPLGVKIYYSSPHTLTTSSTKIAEGTVGDAKVAKPTVINSVPLLLDRIIKGVMQAVEKQGWIKSVIFNTLVYYKFWLDYIPLTSSLLNYAIFQKVKNELGGELKRVVVGGAPLSPQTHDTFRAIFGCSLQVGYASTETSSCTSGMNEGDYKTGHCGSPCLNVLIRLDNWEEGDYRITDKPYPRGEILVGGPSVVKGYFKMPEETEKTFVEKYGIRWFRSGDIGEIDSNGCIKIIDRKKDLVKLKHGEYISLGNAESLLKTLNVVDNMCIFADSSRDKTVAVLVPDIIVLRQIAARFGVESKNMSLEELCDEDHVIDAVLKEIQLHGRRCGLSRWEIPAAVHLTKEMWTPDTGLVTAAFKLRRKQLNRQYQTMVLDMYSRLDD